MLWLCMALLHKRKDEQQTEVSGGSSVHKIILMVVVGFEPTYKVFQTCFPLVANWRII